MVVPHIKTRTRATKLPSPLMHLSHQVAHFIPSHLIPVCLKVLLSDKQTNQIISETSYE